MLRHIQTAVKAVAKWWVNMSDVEKRQTRQRAISIAAVAAAFAVGGPLVGYRFDAQQMDESYRIDAPSLNAAIRRAGLDHAAVADARLISGREAWHPVSYAPSTPQQLVSREVADGQTFAGLLNASIATLGQATAERTQLDCLAEAVYYEARSETVRGQRAVAEVVMNRVKNPHFPKTVCGVVYQGRLDPSGVCQFTFVCDGSKARLPKGEAWERARDVALHTMLGLSAPITRNATHYHTDYVDPYWSASLIETTVIGSHIFYRMPSTRAEWTATQASLAADQARRAEVFDPAQSSDADLVVVSGAPAPAEASAPVAVPPTTAAALSTASLVAF
jgi:spore germination cell wall hydrolase CwlJ-like protein